MAKPKQAHIYVYGDIYNYQGNDAAANGFVSLKYVVDILNANPDAEEFVVHINSRGGDVTEGFAIYDMLINSGKTIITSVEGQCASIATVVGLAGSIRRGNRNSECMIHNAWADPFTMTGYNADDYAEMADFIREADARMLALYVEKTGAPEEDLKAKMAAETFLSADEALALGFFTEINEPLKAVAYLNKPVKPVNNNQLNIMNIKALAKKAAAALLALGGDESVQAAESTLSDGTKVYYDGELADGTAIFTDAELTTAAADGDYTLEDGSVITVTDGKVSAITDAPGEEEATVEGLQARVLALETENATLREENTLAETTLTNINARLAKMQGSFKPPVKKAEGRFNRQPAAPAAKFQLPAKKEGGTN